MQVKQAQLNVGFFVSYKFLPLSPALNSILYFAPIIYIHRYVIYLMRLPMNLMSATGRRRQQHYEQCFSKWIEQYSFVSQRVWCVVRYIIVHISRMWYQRCLHEAVYSIETTVLPRLPPLPSISLSDCLLTLPDCIASTIYFVNQFHSSRTNE